MFEVIFYKDRRGNEPIREYIDDLQRRGVTSKRERILYNKTLTYIRALRKYGTRVGEPIVKHIEDDIWELRPADNRILFFLWLGDTFVLLHHFVKKTKKTPKKEIEQAKRNMADFLEEEAKDEKNRR